MVDPVQRSEEIMDFISIPKNVVENDVIGENGNDGPGLFVGPLELRYNICLG